MELFLLHSIIACAVSNRNKLNECTPLAREQEETNTMAANLLELSWSKLSNLLLPGCATTPWGKMKVRYYLGTDIFSFKYTEANDMSTIRSYN